MVSFVSDRVWYFDCNWKLVPFRQATYFIKYKRERLFINGLISAFAVLCLGVFIGKSLKFDELLAIGAAISIMDILSFTKYGKRTINAKAMSNIHFMS